MRVRLVALTLALALLHGCAGVPGLAPSQATPEEQRAYDAALESLDSDPALAEQRLQEFVRRYPSGPLSDDARVRLGELALSRGDRDAALQQFDYVVRNHSGSDQVDLARLRAAQILILRGDAAGAERVLQRLRLSRLTREEQRAAYRALADAAPDDVTRLRRLAKLRSFESDEDAIALVDVEIDRVLHQLSRKDVRRAASQLGRDIPAGRAMLRAGELALEEGDLAAAREAFEKAAELPIAPAYAERLEGDMERLTLREAGVAPQGEPLPTFSEAASAGAPRTEGATGTLGVVLPLSGPLAEFGEQSLMGVLLAARVFEASDTEVRVLVRDSKGRPELAAEAVRDLAQHEEVSAIVGPLAGGECEAAAAAAEQAEVPLLALTSREKIAATRPHVLRLRTRPDEEVRALVEHSMQLMGAQTFAILYPDDPYGRGQRDLFWDAVEERGGAIVGVARYDPQANDFAEPIRRLVGYVLLSPEQKQALKERETMLRKARRLPPEEAFELREEARALTTPDGEALPPIVDFDALFIPESHEKVVLIAPQLAFHEAQGMRLLGPSGWYSDDLVRIGRNHVEGAIFTAQFFPDSDVPYVHEFAQRYRDAYATEPDLFGAQGYDAATLVLAQLADGRDSREDVRRGLLRARGFPGVTGVLSMRADGNARKRPYLLEVTRGEIVEIE